MSNPPGAFSDPKASDRAPCLADRSRFPGQQVGPSVSKSLWPILSTLSPVLHISPGNREAATAIPAARDPGTPQNPCVLASSSTQPRKASALPPRLLRRNPRQQRIGGSGSPTLSTAPAPDTGRTAQGSPNSRPRGRMSRRRQRAPSGPRPRCSVGPVRDSHPFPAPGPAKRTRDSAPGMAAAPASVSRRPEIPCARGLPPTFRRGQ